MDSFGVFLVIALLVGLALAGLAVASVPPAQTVHVRLLRDCGDCVYMIPRARSTGA